MICHAKVEKFTVDTMIDMLEKLGFKINFAMPSLEEACITIEKQGVIAQN
jgi:hypothetical protein